MERMTRSYFSESAELFDEAMTSIYRLIRKEGRMLDVKSSCDCPEVFDMHFKRLEKLEEVASLLNDVEMEFIKNAEVA